MKLLITGSEGFIGKNLVNYLSRKYDGLEIIGWDRKAGRDVLDITESYLKVENIGAVIHLAAQTSVWNKDISQIEYDNIRGFIHIYELCKKLNIRLVFASSSCALNPTSMYGLSKKFDEDFSELYWYENFVCLRLHNVYGKNSREDTLLGKCLNENEIILYNNGLNSRHFTYIDDVCKGIEKGLTVPSGVYNVINPEENLVIDVVNEVKKYEDINVVLTPEKREFDLERQIADGKIPNIITSYTPINKGIKLVFENGRK